MSDTCICTVWEPAKDSDRIRFCAEDHRYWLGSKELASVSSVIRQMWPIRKNFEAADPAVLEHARERGVRVDAYISEYVTTGNVTIKAGEWQEVVDLVRKFVPWWQARYPQNGTRPQAQVILHDNEIAGTCDLIPEQSVVDLKTVYDVDVSYALQVGAYAELYEKMYGLAPEGIGIVHLTKRFPQPKWIPLDLEECVRDWKILRAAWSMVQRRTA